MPAYPPTWKQLQRDGQLGAIIGFVDLIDCVRFEELPEEYQSDFAQGPYCWLLRNPRAIQSPIPYTGQVRLFNVPDEYLELEQIGKCEK